MRHLPFPLVFLLVFLAPGAVASQEKKKRPNVLVVITDDMRWDCMSVAGHKHLKTKHLDRLAKQGVHFRNAFCTTSLCSPSRASILSGLYAHRHQVVDNFTDYPRDLDSFARVLQRLGYLTGYIGKWHMGEDNDDPRPGFDYFVSHKGQGKYFNTEFNLNGKRREVKKGYYTHVVTDMALDWMKENKAKPFLLMLGHKAPHSFYVPEEKYKDTFKDVRIPYPKTAFALKDKPAWFQTRLTTWHGIYGPLFEYREKFPDARPEAVADFENMIRSYWATIQSVDDGMGRLLEFLEAEGLLDDTIIIFVGDNGLLNGEHGMVDKRTMHEPSIRVPLLVRYPGLTPPDRPQVVDKMVLHQDLAPSILELCDAPPMKGIHGRSWAPLLRGGGKDWRTSWFYEYNYEKEFPYTPNVRGVRTEEWVYIRYPHGDGKADRHKAELYHLASDPDQTKNLIDDPAQRERIEAMGTELIRLQRAVGLEEDRMPLDQGIKQVLPSPKIR